MGAFRRETKLGTTTVKKGSSKKEFTDEERFLLAAQSPFFVKKKKDAVDLIKKVGLPDHIAKRLKK